MEPEKKTRGALIGSIIVIVILIIGGIYVWQNKIIILENFIAPDVSDALIRFYEAEKKNLSRLSDNELSLSSISDRRIKKILFAISNRVLQLMQKHYPLTGRNYQLDHGGMYVRIPGNFCAYHTDNVYFDCPIHGRNQDQLRAVCPGDCPGAIYVPNHTYWREYTALIYLNDAFTGGELAFEDGPHNKFYKKVISIKPNMLVLAPNGPHFYHEVYPIRSGKRYSVHLWYTSDPQICRSWK